MGSALQRPWDFGIIYAAVGGNPGTYVDAKGVTQDYITLTGSYLEMTTVITGGVDTSKPFAGAFGALTLSCEFAFQNATEFKLKLQTKRIDETVWHDLQIALQSDPGTVAAEQTIASTATGAVYQTASILSAQQIRVVAKYSAGSADDGDSIVIRAEVG